VHASTGSLVIYYGCNRLQDDAERRDELLRSIEARRLLDLDHATAALTVAQSHTKPSSIGANGPSLLGVAVDAGVSTLDRAVRHATRNIADIESLVPFIASAYSALTRSMRSTPMWLTLTLYSIGAFIDLYERHEASSRVRKRTQSLIKRRCVRKTRCDSRSVIEPRTECASRFPACPETKGSSRPPQSGLPHKTASHSRARIPTAAPSSSNSSRMQPRKRGCCGASDN
jgi:hypothetical protein